MLFLMLLWMSASLRRPLDLSTDRPIQWRRGSGTILAPFPLLWRLALGSPGVYGGNFLLESRVDEAVAFERVEALEVGRDDEAGKGLAAAACGKSVKHASCRVVERVCMRRDTMNGAAGPRRTGHVGHFHMRSFEAHRYRLPKRRLC
jgi:hypothetical protein